MTRVSSENIVINSVCSMKISVYNVRLGLDNFDIFIFSGYWITVRQYHRIGGCCVGEDMFDINDCSSSLGGAGKRSLGSAGNVRSGDVGHPR